MLFGHLTGARAPDASPRGAAVFNVETFVVRSANDVAAHNGVVEFKSSMWMLRLVDGRELPVAFMPAPLHQQIGTRAPQSPVPTPQSPAVAFPIDMPDPITPQLRHTHTVNEVLEAADSMSSEELDRLPYGMIQLDPAGRILNYNAVESKLASLRKEDAIGKQFFTEIAPCTKVQEFYGRFKEGVIHEALDTSFRFHFAFKQNPRDVTVRLLYSKRTRTVWVLISDASGEPLASSE